MWIVAIWNCQQLSKRKLTSEEHSHHYHDNVAQKSVKVISSNENNNRIQLRMEELNRMNRNIGCVLKTNTNTLYAIHAYIEMVPVDNQLSSDLHSLWCTSRTWALERAFKTLFYHCRIITIDGMELNGLVLAKSASNVCHCSFVIYS